MVAVTYDVGRTTGANRAKAKNSAAGKSWFARFFDALIESRMRQARREIARHAHLLPHTVDEHGNRVPARLDEFLPFGGW